MLERIYRCRDFELNVSDAEMNQILAKKLMVSVDKFKEMLQTAIKWNCFDKIIFEKNCLLTSPGIKRRAGVVVNKCRKMSELYANKTNSFSDAETIPETPQSKVKESKVKQSKVKQSKVKQSRVKDSKVKDSKVKDSKRNKEKEEMNKILYENSIVVSGL